MDRAVRSILQSVSQEAAEILKLNRDILDSAAVRLLEVETLDETELREIAKGLQRPVAAVIPGADESATIPVRADPG